MTEVYGVKFAELYDLFYGEKDYEGEARFVHSQIRRHSTGTARKLLELACGTGRHATELEKHGYNVIATDISESMLARARQLARPGLEFRWQDMRAIDVTERPFDVVVALFDSLGYLGSNDAIAQSLERIRDHLRPGGVFVCEFWHAAAMLRSYDPVRVRRWTTPNGSVTRISETQLDVERQLATVRYEVFAQGGDGRCKTFVETHVNRFFLVQEMAALMERAGLTPVGWYADWSDAPVGRDTWHVLSVTRREE